MTRQYCLNRYRLLEHHESAQSERVLTNQYMGKLNNAKDIKHSKAIKLESGDVRLQKQNNIMTFEQYTHFVL